MPSFVHESLLWWGLPLVGLPILIHLINLMRHRRVEWAAMEFLLESQKRHRRSILFKELLLLVLRMLAVAAVVLMLAQPLLRNRFGALLGGSKTHHVVLVDDSFSMSDHWADTSAFDQAKRVVEQLGTAASRRDTPQLFTVLRFSRARQLAAGTQPDMLAAPVDSAFVGGLEKLLGGLAPSQTAAGAEAALEAVDRLPPKADDEDRIVYVISDFRAREWQQPQAARATLERLDRAGVQIQLINCVDAAHQNLAISSLRVAPGTRAAGVPLAIDVTVENFGPAAAKLVSVSLEEDGQTRPSMVLEEVPAGKRITRRFGALFPAAGQHLVTARLEGDAVSADNSRSLVVDVASTVDVLLVDGDARGQDAYFLSAALAPGGKITSGLRPQIESPRYLADHPLDHFSAIYLLNIARLERNEIAALETYARGGGGVGIFLGEQSRAEFFNSELYRDGRGLFPLPLAAPAELAIDRLETAPDLEVADHPVFAIFAGERNSFINTVRVRRYFAAAKNWSPPDDSPVRVIARLRNKAPLAVESTFGEGRVVAILTKASPLETALGSWNNWGRDNPSFVVTMLELQSYLSAPRTRDASLLVGTPLEVPVDTAKTLPQVRFVLPAGAGGGAVSVDATTTESGHAAVLSETGASGVYQAHLTASDGSQQVENYAFNVEPDEGDLRKLEATQLAGQLQGIRYTYYDARDINYSAQQLAGFNLGESLLYLLVAVLVGEQLLAYACSYHPAAAEGRRR